MKYTRHVLQPGSPFVKLPENGYPRVQRPLSGQWQSRFTSTTQRWNCTILTLRQRSGCYSQQQAAMYSHCRAVLLHRGRFAPPQDYTEIDRLFKLPQQSFSEQPGMKPCA
jgi:hypothetical protein